MWQTLALHPQGIWLTLGGLLLAAEMLGAGGYLLWSGVAAMLTGLLLWLLPLGWQVQLLAFALLTLLTAGGWWLWLKRRPGTPAARRLNRRGEQLIGTRATLRAPLHNGYGRLEIGDSSWRIHSDAPLQAGDEVEVIAIDGITLEVRPLRRP
ncbi:NfeD family protein [Nissabacter sp. SGAir0207]|uniref:NfeD family protein n=1 Tax=Nissabacter sp. SGAir0207 TaxID=2126321 RepID=UPI0010CD0BC5|nr:NfeD family protein [Nissabacter sp. SGAir0207]QCR36842.1 NfeD family protein [Nissabacter sp. SGAir0207]